jgi:hypothetical protein
MKKVNAFPLAAKRLMDASQVVPVLWAGVDGAVMK